ncbi:MAG: type II toxin-antitoxin system VapC family toxin [Gaiella sp.]
MIVLDTHAWLWVIVAPQRLSRAARAAIDRAGEIGISTMSFWEVALLERAGRIRLDRGAQNWTRATLVADPRMTALPITPEIALTAGTLSTIRDPGDSLIYATAVEHNAHLVTKDARIAEHDPQRVIW